MSAEDCSLLDLNGGHFSFTCDYVAWKNPFVEDLEDTNDEFVKEFLKSKNPKEDYPNWYAFLNGQELRFESPAVFYIDSEKSEDDAKEEVLNMLKNMDSLVHLSRGRRADVDWHVELLSIPEKKNMELDAGELGLNLVRCKLPIKIFLTEPIVPSSRLEKLYSRDSWMASFSSMEARSQLQWIRDYMEHPDSFYYYSFSSNNGFVLFKNSGESRDSQSAIVEDFLNHYHCSDDLLKICYLWSCYAEKGTGFIKDFLKSESRLESLREKHEGEMLIPLANTDKAILLKEDLTKKDWYESYLKSRKESGDLFVRYLGMFLSKGLEQRDEYFGEKVVAAIRKNPERFVNCSNARFAQFAKSVMACNAQKLSDEEYRERYFPKTRETYESSDGATFVTYKYQKEDDTEDGLPF